MHGKFTSITIESPNSDNHILISPEGIWVCGKDSKVSAALHMQGKCPVLAVMDHRKSTQTGHQIAFWVDEKGEPCIQIARGNDVINFGGEDLMDKLRKLKE